MKLNRFNSLFYHLLLNPLFTVLYYPINRYIMLPKFGNGAPYVDTAGNLVEQYFSANQMALIFAILIEAVSVYLCFKQKNKAEKGPKRTFYLIGCLFFTLITMVLFLEFSLWG